MNKVKVIKKSDPPDYEREHIIGLLNIWIPRHSDKAREILRKHERTENEMTGKETKAD